MIGWVVTAAGFPAAFAVMAGSFVAAAAVIVAFVREQAGARDRHRARGRLA